ncbi:hypothetical protein BsWGS_25954 [Bradybaena similaris]
MPAVVSEDLATQSSLFAPVDKNAPSGCNYLSIRRNRYWKQTMAAWSSVDAFCSSIYQRKNPGLSLECCDSPTDACDIHEMQFPISPSTYGDQSADIDSIDVNKSQNRVSDSDQRVCDVDGSVSVRNFDSKSSRLLRSSSSSSLARDITLHRSTSTSDATPSSYKTRAQSDSEVHSRRASSQVKTKGYNNSGACHSRQSSSATLNSNCQQMAAVSGSSSSDSCLDSPQDHCTGTPQKAKVVSKSSARKQSTQKVSHSSCSHSGDSQNPVDRHSSDEGRNEDKLCGVCQQPYVNHNELVLLSPGLFRQKARFRRIGPRKANNPTNRRWLYRRRNDLHKPGLQYCSLLSSNFLLAQALQTWLARSFQRPKGVKNAHKIMKDSDESVKDADESVKDADESANDSDESVKNADESVKDADYRVAADDSSIETETHSESVRSMLYELLMQIKSRMSSASDVTKKVIASGTDDTDERNTIPKDNPEVTQKVGQPDDCYIDTAGRHENDAGLQTPSGRNAISSIADRQGMSNTRQNPKNADSTENIYFQNLFLKPRKNYIDNRRSRRKGYHGSSKEKRSQDNPNSKIATKDDSRPQAMSCRAFNRKLQRNEDVAWEIMEDGKRQFTDKGINNLQQKNYTDALSRYELKRVDRRNMAVDDEGETRQRRADDCDRSSEKQNMAYDAMDSPVKKYHYKCVTIEGRETILKLEHDPNKICSFENVSKTDQPKKNAKSVVEEDAGLSVEQNDRLRQQGKDYKVENVNTSEEPTDSVKIKPENEQSQATTACKEPKLEEAQLEAPAEAGDGTDKVDEELTQGTVFDKTYSEREAEKERRVLRRFAREPANDVKMEPECERISGSTPCRDPNTREAQVAASMEVGDGQDKVGEEMKYSTVFHKKYHRPDAEKERRMMRRFAREQLRAHHDKDSLEGKTAPIGRIPSWSETYVKLMKRRQKHSNKQCIIGKQVMSTDNVEESQQKVAEEPTENAPDKDEAAIVDKPLPYKPLELARQLPGLGFLERLFRVPVPTQMTPANKLEVIEPPSLTRTLATGRAEYLSMGSQDELILSAEPDRREGIKSEQHTDNTCGVGIKSAQYTDTTCGLATDNEETIQEVESTIFQGPLPNQLTPKNKVKIDNPSITNKCQTSRSANLKGSLDIRKRYEKIGGGEGIKPPNFKENVHVEETNINSTVKPRSETGHVMGTTQLTSKRTFKIDNSSSRKTIHTAKDSQDILAVSKKSVKGTEIKSPGFQNNILAEKRDKKTTRKLVASQITDIQEPTLLTPKRTFKIDSLSNTKDFKAAKMSREMFEWTNKSEKGKDIKLHDFRVRTLVEQTDREMSRLKESESSQFQVPTILSTKIYSKSYNRKMKASAASFFSKTISDNSKSPKKTALGEYMKPKHFKDAVSVKQAGVVATTEIPGSELAELVQPIQPTRKRQYKMGLTDRAKKLKASNEAYFSKSSPNTIGSSKKADIEEEVESRQNENVLDEQTHHDITQQAAESEEARLPDSPESVDVDTKGGLLDIAMQKVGTWNSVEEGISESLENLVHQIFSKLLEPLGLKIINDLEEFGHSNQPLKYRIPASISMYPPPASRPVYLSEFLTWLGVKQTDDSSSDDEEDEEDDDEKPYNHSKRNKYGRRPEEGFPPNVKVADSFSYLRVRKLDKLKNEDNAAISQLAESSFISPESLQMNLNEGVSEGISSVDAADTHTTSRPYADTSLTLSERKDVTTTDSSNMQSDKAAADKPPSLLPESKKTSIHRSSSKIFHKKYNTKGKLVEKEMLAGRIQVPWRKKERVVDEGTAAKWRENMKTMSPKCLFAKQAERTRQKQKREKELKQSQDKLSQQKQFKKGKTCSLGIKDVEEPVETSDIDEKPCRACMSSEEYYQTLERSSSKDGEHDQPGGSKHDQMDLIEPSQKSAEEVGVLEEQGPGMLPLEQQVVEAELDADAVEAGVTGFGETPEDQQTARENHSVLKAISRLLQDIPVDLLSKKFLRELTSFQERNTPLKYKIPSTNERVTVEHAEPIYLSQLLALLKAKRFRGSKKGDEDHIARTLQASLTKGGRVVRPELLPEDLQRAGPSSHLFTRGSDHVQRVGPSTYPFPRRSDHKPQPWLRAGGLSTVSLTSLSHEVSYMSNILAEDDNVDPQVSYPPIVTEPDECIDCLENVPDESLETVPDECIDCIENVLDESIENVPDEPSDNVWEEPTENVPDEPVKPSKRPCKIFHKQMSTEGKLREKEILGSWGKQPYKEEKDTKEEMRPCRDPPVVEEPPPKKNVFSKQAEKTEERELREKEFEKEYVEFFGESSSPSLKGEDEPVGEEMGGDDGTGVSGEDGSAVSGEDGSGVSGEDGSGVSGEDGSGVSGKEGSGVSAGPTDVDVSEGIGLDNQETDLPFGIGEENAREGNEAKAKSDLDVGDIPSSRNQLLQQVTETLVNRQPLSASATRGKRARPYRYTMPSDFEMYKAPEAHPIYMARDTPDHILSFLGLRKKDSLDVETEHESGGRTAQRGRRKRSLGVQDALLKTSFPWRSPNILTQLKSKFLREELGASTSTSSEYQRNQFWDFQSSLGRGMLDYTTRAFNKVTSPSRQRDMAKSHIDFTQRSPSLTEAVQRQIRDFQTSVGRGVLDYTTRAYNKVTSPTIQSGNAKPHVDSTRRSPSTIEAVQRQFWEFQSSMSHSVVDYTTRAINEIRSPTYQREKAKSHVDSRQRSPSPPESVQKKSRDFQTSESRGMYDNNTREVNKMSSPTRHGDKTKPHVDSRQRSPSATEAAQREFDDRGFERYQGSKGYNIGSPGLEVLPEEDSKLDAPHSSQPSELFRWVGKSRFERIRQPDTLGEISEGAKGFLDEPERLVGEVGQSLQQTQEVEQRQNVQRTEPYFKGTFPQAFEDSVVGSVVMRILDEILDFGRRNIPLKYEARQQQFLEMSSAAQPIYISRKTWDTALGSVGLSSADRALDEDESCESETKSSSDIKETTAPQKPAAKPPHEDPDDVKKRVADEELDSNPEDDIPTCILRGGIVESHRELTFYCPPIPLPKRFRSVIRRRCHRFEDDYPTTSRVPFIRKEIICYGRTKQLKSHCDIWSRSELDRSSHFCRSGRYYRKHLFRKRLNLRNILSECGKSKEWKRLEERFKERSEMVRNGYDKNVDSIDNKISDPVRKYGPDSLPNDVSNSQSGLAHSMKCDFFISPPRFKTHGYDWDRCSNYREDDPWAFPDGRMALDTRAGAQGDYLHHTLPPSRKSYYGSPVNNARTDVRTLMHSVKIYEGSHALLPSVSQLKSNAAGMLPFVNTPGSLGKHGFLRSIGASRRGLVAPEANRWRGNSSANWSGCHNNALPLTTSPTERKIRRSGSFLDSSNSQVVKPLGHQQNSYRYRDVRTRRSYTGSCYIDDESKLYSLIHSSAALIPTRTY